MKNSNKDIPDQPEDQIKQLQKENNRLQRIIKRHETQLQHLDKMASANEKTNIALYKELEVLQQQAEAHAREAVQQASLDRVRAETDRVEFPFFRYRERESHCRLPNTLD